MDVETERMSAELAEELASSERRIVDPRSVPVRFHHLKAMAQSAAHCLAAFQEHERRDSLAIRVGAGVHAMLFEMPVTMWTGKVRNGKVWDAFRTEHAGRTILNRKEHAKASAIAASVRRHPIAAQLLFGPATVRERSIEWEQLGRARRSTPDVRAPHYVVELKSTRCSEPNRFCRDATFRGYHAQLADQIAAIEHETGIRPEHAYVVAVETIEPFAVTVLQLTERALQRGEQLCRLWLERLLVCESANHWPAYCESVDVFDVPDDEIELTFGEASDDEDAP